MSNTDQRVLNFLEQAKEKYETERFNLPFSEEEKEIVGFSLYLDVELFKMGIGTQSHKTALKIVLRNPDRFC